MDIVVCIKQVPETNEIGWNQETGALNRTSIPGILNPNDKNALEAALQLKESHGGIVTAISMGPPQADEVLREAIGMGVDKGVLLNDRQFAGADTLSTAYTLAQALKKIGGFDLILCGKETSDGMTAHVGPQVAEFLDLPQLTCAIEIEIKTKNNSVRIKQKLEHGFRILETSFPAVITVEREINQPRIPPMDSIMEAYREKEVVVWGMEDLGGEREYFGLNGSPTQCRRVYTKKVTKGKVQLLEGEAGKVAKRLVEILKQKDLV